MNKIIVKIKVFFRGKKTILCSVFGIAYTLYLYSLQAISLDTLVLISFIGSVVIANKLSVKRNING